MLGVTVQFTDWIIKKSNSKDIQAESVRNTIKYNIYGTIKNFSFFKIFLLKALKTNYHKIPSDKKTFNISKS